MAVHDTTLFPSLLLSSSRVTCQRMMWGKDACPPKKTRLSKTLTKHADPIGGRQVIGVSSGHQFRHKHIDFAHNLMC